MAQKKRFRDSLNKIQKSGAMETRPDDVISDERGRVCEDPGGNGESLSSHV